MRTLVILLALAGCEGSGSAKKVDASNACTKALYDPCLSEHDCSSGVCHGFTGGPLVCTQACTPGGTPCPMQSGAAVDCDASGFCKPAAANTCMFPP
jgi:hypothetical protein